MGLQEGGTGHSRALGQLRTDLAPIVHFISCPSPEPFPKPWGAWGKDSQVPTGSLLVCTSLKKGQCGTEWHILEKIYVNLLFHNGTEAKSAS